MSENFAYFICEIVCNSVVMFTSEFGAFSAYQIPSISVQTS